MFCKSVQKQLCRRSG